MLQSVILLVLGIVAFPLHQHLPELIRLNGFLPRTHAGRAGCKAFRTDATAAETFFVLHHVNTAVLTGTSHTIIPLPAHFVFLFYHVFALHFTMFLPPKRKRHGFLMRS
jgi:hypothetical protein